MKPNFNYKDAELYIFGDASSKGWSAVLYVRVRAWTDSAVVFHWIQIFAWETMVKVTKNILRRQFGNSHMPVEQLNTALVEIDAVLNIRPLVPLSPDASEDAITQSMLITGFNIKSFPDRFVDIHYSPSSR
ncbi:unnamed protein product [Lepeophtheirus salmonis]|uniref:(salmon louse) hypothetical protein n=1 Tax=Lepeophtheirus salmonis TaxID=72036 RepID=A0A7R8CN33_LEPSM|nr:unnamed protein product [Lepeophtheirus salmonis]CAF2871772.1 unnamed protein product [Lepeophtheirus salmonis]